MISQEERNKNHAVLMVSILKNLADTPLVLKGGTALYLAYGLNRFSEDLDFDSSKRLNIQNRLMSSMPKGISLLDVNQKKDTETVSRYILRYRVDADGWQDALKVEVSYRNPVPEEKVNIQNGMRFAPLSRIIDNKLQAAFDGNNPRTKARDLFDLHHLSKNYPNHFSSELSARFQLFAQNPDTLVSVYQADFRRDPLLHNADLEQIALELSEAAQSISDRHKEFAKLENDYNLNRHLFSSKQQQIEEKAFEIIHGMPLEMQQTALSNLYRSQLDTLQRNEIDHPEIER